jgi:hypothetical protein
MPTQLPVSLPPHLLRQINPAMTILPPTWPPGCRLRPGENCHISIPNQHLMPPNNCPSQCSPNTTLLNHFNCR